jgi:hypothetical protein
MAGTSESTSYVQFAILTWSKFVDVSFMTLLPGFVSQTNEIRASVWEEDETRCSIPCRSDNDAFGRKPVYCSSHVLPSPRRTKSLCRSTCTLVSASWMKAPAIFGTGAAIPLSHGVKWGVGGSVYKPCWRLSIKLSTYPTLLPHYFLHVPNIRLSSFFQLLFETTMSVLAVDSKPMEGVKEVLEFTCCTMYR